jgi:RIO kinase 1
MPNSPYLDASVQWRIKAGTLDLHESGYRSTVEAILSSGLATEVVGLISAGKEADVYLTQYNGAPLAVKVYRLYRTSHRGGGPIKADSMGWRAAHEFEMTRQAWKGGARVPAPARRVENMFSMRYLGDEEGPAPRLQDVRLDDPEGFLGKVLEAVEVLARAGVVHSDLSPFNILVFHGDPWLIDLAGAIRVDRTGTSPWVRLQEARGALLSGGVALERYFRRYGCAIDSEGLANRIVASRDRFHVLDSTRATGEGDGP